MDNGWVTVYPDGRSNTGRTLNAEQIEASYPAGVSDAMLVHQSRDGKPRALEALLDRHSDDLLRYCQYLVPRREDAEDVYQETLTRAISSMSTLRNVSAFRAWLFTIARNLAKDVARHGCKTYPLIDEDALPAPRYHDTPLDRAEVGEEHATVAQALTKLAMGQQKILFLREVEGLSYAEIARKLDISLSAVETQLFRARRRLRDEYTRASTAVPVSASA